MKLNGYELLGNAIVLQAAKDYRIALRTQHLNPNDKKKQYRGCKTREVLFRRVF